MSQSPDGDFFDPELCVRWSTSHDGLESQSPDGDFFDPEGSPDGNADEHEQSQSPDGDFFDPEYCPSCVVGPADIRHSPLTGIFLIRSTWWGIAKVWVTVSHSPLTGIFLIRSGLWYLVGRWGAGSQSPDGDFFDPEKAKESSQGVCSICHSPLTGIFLIRRRAEGALFERTF